MNSIFERDERLLLLGKKLTNEDKKFYCFDKNKITIRNLWFLQFFIYVVQKRILPPGLKLLMDIREKIIFLWKFNPLHSLIFFFFYLATIP